MVEETTISREPDPDISPSRKALVGNWLQDIKAAKDTKFKHVFRRMRRDMKFAAGSQWPALNENFGDGNDAYGMIAADEDKYVANIVQRHIKQRVAALYAKNPKAVSRRRPRLDFAFWDEKPESLMMAMQAATIANEAGAEPDPMAIQIVQDAAQGKAHRDMLDRLGKTLEVLFHYYMAEGIPTFKQQAKQVVRRVMTCGIAYVKLGFQRIMGMSPDTVQKISDFQRQIEHIQRLAADVADDEISETDPEMEAMRIAIASLQSQAEVILREGLIFDFPLATAIIPSPDTRQVKGFVGSRWIAEEYFWTPNDIKEKFKIDVGKRFTTYQQNHKKNPLMRMGHTMEYALCYQVHDLEAMTEFFVCDGYPDFLQEPGAPDVWMEQGHPYFALSFNDLENEEDPFPPSDVHLLRHMQLEYNRARQGIREHRIANKPGYISAKGVLEGEDKTNLENHVSNELIELNFTQGIDIKTLIQNKPVVPIDPAVYDVEYVFTDIMRVGGAQEANLGGTAGDTATETSIAESSRMTDIASNVDDTDDFLTDIARASGQIMLNEVSEQTAKRVAGAGAVWPEHSRTEVAEEIFLEIEAGSSGRPNKSAEIANAERLAPFIIQIPGVNPRWFGEELLKRMDDRLDLTDAFLEGLPSIVAQNAMSKMSANPQQGEPRKNPDSQGGEGQENAEAADETQAGAQPAFPQPER